MDGLLGRAEGGPCEENGCDGNEKTLLHERIATEFMPFCAHLGTRELGGRAGFCCTVTIQALSDKIMYIPH